MNHDGNPLFYLIAITPMVTLLLFLWQVAHAYHHRGKPRREARVLRLLVSGLALALSLTLIPLIYGALSFPG